MSSRRNVNNIWKLKSCVIKSFINGGSDVRVGIATYLLVKASTAAVFVSDWAYEFMDFRLNPHLFIGNPECFSNRLRF
ncbi:hypothetical protein F2Q68_00030719 [Brassica cretica]|uniref:Uncharacterized protein n=1 Tax=Brassica cretica TaxID=69181 RepID=A0A8S9G736_BRACR|nr:hypothetical protein F2Q68_00030719 [Brassica cretica]